MSSPLLGNTTMSLTLTNSFCITLTLPENKCVSLCVQCVSREDSPLDLWLVDARRFLAFRSRVRSRHVRTWDLGRGRGTPEARSHEALEIAAGLTCHDDESRHVSRHAPAR